MTVAGLDFRRAASATAVLLLHLGLLGAFIFFADSARTVIRNPFREIVITFPATSRPHPPRSEIQPRFLSPAKPAIPALPGPTQPQVPPASAISGVGRALFACGRQTLDLLPANDRAGCLRLLSHSTAQTSFLLPPPDPNSPFTKEIEERFREATPINHPCPLGSFNDTHGLPCFGHAGEEASSIFPAR